MNRDKMIRKEMNRREMIRNFCLEHKRTKSYNEGLQKGRTEREQEILKMIAEEVYQLNKSLTADKIIEDGYTSAKLRCGRDCLIRLESKIQNQSPQAKTSLSSGAGKQITRATNKPVDTHSPRVSRENLTTMKNQSSELLSAESGYEKSDTHSFNSEKKKKKIGLGIIKAARPENIVISK